MNNIFRLKDGRTAIRVNDKNITHFTIPNGVTTIGYCAFSGCYALQSIEIPNSVISIEDCAFSGCKVLRNIDIPDSVRVVWESAFDGCSALQSINVGENNEQYTSIDGVLFNKKLTSIIKFPQGKELKVYEIPRSVTIINNRAFNGCSVLQRIDIPNRVTSIGDSSFFRCSSLQSVDIPNSVVSIGDSAFAFCSSLLSIDIPSSVRNIGMSAFKGCSLLQGINIPNSILEVKAHTFEDCSALQRIIIPNNVMEIGGYAFYNCRALKHIKLPDGLTKIKSGAFSGCSALIKITIPDNVKSIWAASFSDCSALKCINIPFKVNWIGNCAFRGCSSLESLIVSKRNQTFTSIDGILFDKQVSKIIRVPIGVDNFSFPDSVTTIGDHAFEGCSSLKSIVIPNSVTTIEECAFKGCTALQSIYLQVKDIKNLDISESAFENINTYNCILHVPQGAGWSSDCHPALKKFINVKIDSLDIINTTLINNIFELSKDGKTITGIIDKNITCVTIPDNVTTIAECAFIHCPALQSVNISDSIAEIGLGAFAILTNKASLQHIHVSNDNNFYTSVDGVLFSKDLSVIITFPRGRELKEYKIPNSVKTIGSAAFWGCTSLQNIDIPYGVKAIQDSVFGYCTSLQNIDIPNSVTEIGEGVFESCSALRSIHIHIVDIQNANISETAFDGIDTDNCVLYIPPGTRWVYRHHSILSKFKNIEIENITL